MRFFWVLILSSLIYATPIHATPAVTTIAALPGSTVYAIKTDAVGNIYVAGSKGAAVTSDAFVAKLSPAGAVIYSTTFAGSGSDSAVAIDIDSSGAACARAPSWV